MYIIGMGFELLATLLGTIGKQLVSHSGRMAEGPRSKKYRNAGLAITTILGPVADTTAFAFAPQSLVAPLAGMDVVWNVLSAPLTLGERPAPCHCVGAFLVAGGAALTAVFGPHDTPDWTPEELEHLIWSSNFLVYCMCFGVFLTASFFILRSWPRGSRAKIRAFALGATAGCIAGNMFFVSAALALLKYFLRTWDWSVFEKPLLYFLLVGAVAAAVGNIPFISRGLQEFEAIFMVTLFEGCHIFVACLTGQVVLGELGNGATVRVILYWASVGVILAGLSAIGTTTVGGIMRPTPPEAPSAISITESRITVPLPEDNPARELVSPEERGNVSPGGGVVVWAGSIAGVALSDLGSLVEHPPHTRGQQEESGQCTAT